MEGKPRDMQKHRKGCGRGEGERLGGEGSGEEESGGKLVQQLQEDEV